MHAPGVLLPGASGFALHSQRPTLIFLAVPAPVEGPSYLPLRVCARRHGKIAHLQRLVGALEAPPLRGDGVLALEVVPAAAEPAVLEVDDRFAYELVRAEAVVVVQLPTSIDVGIEQCADTWGWQNKRVGASGTWRIVERTAARPISVEKRSVIVIRK